jgi:hypothetical protein
VTPSHLSVREEGERNECRLSSSLSRSTGRGSLERERERGGGLGVGEVELVSLPVLVVRHALSAPCHPHPPVHRLR